MTDKTGSFPAGFHFENVLRTISKQIYETPFAFIRENVQNAVDAARIQALRDKRSPQLDDYRVDVDMDGRNIRIRDRGNGMSRDDLETLFWTIGASGKHTTEARLAGCVGMFGIGGFANFGVCEALKVVSQLEGDESGTSTLLTRLAIKNAGALIPEILVEESSDAAPRGTLVVGTLADDSNTDEVKSYLKDFVRYVEVPIYFDGELISGRDFIDADSKTNLTQVGDSHAEWIGMQPQLQGTLFEDNNHTIIATLEKLVVGGDEAPVRAQLRFEGGAIDVFKRGFKLCRIGLGTQLGLSGRIDCDKFIPTAGRDSLDAPTTSLLNQVSAHLEQVVLSVILASSDRISQHTRIFPLVIRLGWTEKIGNALVTLADGDQQTLSNIRNKAQGGVKVYFGRQQKQALSQVMSARGHIVVLLSGDRYRRQAEQQYLQSYCQAVAFEGVIECSNQYQELSRFEKVFLSELELNISRAYEVKDFTVIAGELTEDIPTFAKELATENKIEIYVDVRHSEISKLESLGFGSLLYSMISRFCHEYLGPSLRKWSPRFFGSGAINLEFLARRRSELWILLKDDIGTIQQGGKRAVITRSDVHSVSVHDENAPSPGQAMPRILNIVDPGNSTGLAGYYLRLPERAFDAYGDIVDECPYRAVVWVGNKITFVASDSISSSFQYEIRLDRIVAASITAESTPIGGASELKVPLQSMYGGLYFPIPSFLEQYLVPSGDEQICLELFCEWTDMATAKHWAPRDNDVE